jgi:hypothetical protein
VHEIYNHGEYDAQPAVTAQSIDLVEFKEQMQIAETSEKTTISPSQAVTYSPHLSKDFNANGDRIRDSWRARRKQKIRENHLRAKKEGTPLSKSST